MSTGAPYRGDYIFDGGAMRTFRQRNGDIMIKGLLGLLIVFLLATFPATWLLMLFFGSAAPGMGLSYWGTLPLGILVSVLIGGATAPAYVIRD
jgi:hypothetical protein